MYFPLYLRDWRYWYQLARRFDNWLFQFLPRSVKIRYHRNHYPLYRALIDLDPRFVNIGTWDDPLDQANYTPISYEEVFAHNYKRNTRLREEFRSTRPSS